MAGAAEMEVKHDDGRSFDHIILTIDRSFEYLIKIAGDRTVPIELGSRYSDDDWTQKLMTVGDFVRNYCLKRVRFDHFFSSDYPQLLSI